MMPKESGVANAQYNLGECYTNGIGVPRDYTEAEKWLEKAAAQDHAKAKALLQELPNSSQNRKSSRY